MSEYGQHQVSSVSDIISIANDLRSQGKTMNETLKTSVQHVTHEGGDPGRSGLTSSPNTFLENYHKPTRGAVVRRTPP